MTQSRFITNLALACLLAVASLELLTQYPYLLNRLIPGFWIPSLLLVFIGRLTDQRQAQFQIKIASLLLATLFLGLYVWLNILYFLAFALLLCFWGGHLLTHKTDRDQDNTRWAIGFGFLIGAFLIYYQMTWPDQFKTMEEIIIVCLCIIFGLVLITQSMAQTSSESDPLQLESTPKKGKYSDLKVLVLLHFFSFSLGGFFLGFKAGWESPSWMLLGTCAVLGVLLSRWNIPLLGHKRTLSLLYLVGLGLFFYKPENLLPKEEAFFTGFYTVLFTAERWTCTSLFKRSLPQTYAGFFTGLLVFSSITGLAFGLYLFPAFPSSYIPILFFLILMVLNQTIYPERASAEADNQPLQETPWGNAWTHSGHEGQGVKVKTWLKYIQRTFCELFFGKIRVRGLEHLNDLNGALFIANHPNTFFDPLLVSAVLPFHLKFLAKSTLWSIPIIGPFLDYLGLIPVYRPCDVPKGDLSKNQKTLDRASILLTKGNYVLIFPEGVSQPGLTLKPVKTGAARIAYRAHSLSNWAQNLPIIPIGIDYEKPSIFRSSLTIRIGAPVELIDDKEAYSESPKRMVRETTLRLGQALSDLIPNLDTRQQETLTLQVSRLYGPQLCKIMGTDDSNEARLAISNAIRHYCDTDPTSVMELQQKISTYEKMSEHLNLDERSVPITFSTIFSYARAVFSPHMIGLVLHWVPYMLTRYLVRFFRLEFVWQATAKLVTGIVIYPLYYVLIHTILVYLFGALLAYILVAAMAITGILALGHFNRYDFLFQPLETLWNAIWKQDTHTDLAQMRTQLFQDLERFREAYAFHLNELETNRW